VGEIATTPFSHLATTGFPIFQGRLFLKPKSQARWMSNDIVYSPSSNTIGDSIDIGDHTGIHSDAPFAR
jgi:hypothetical protein